MELGKVGNTEERWRNLETPLRRCFSRDFGVESGGAMK